METIASAQIAGLILAGGRASRMGGGDKALIELMGETLLARIIARVRPQVGRLLLNANGDPARFASFGLPVLPDPIGDQWGPLAGILAGLEYLAEERKEIPWLASFPTDSPFLPTDLVEELAAALAGQGADIAMAESRGRLQPVFALWPVRLAGDLRGALSAGVRKVEQFAQRYSLASVAWPEEAFFNINSPEDLHQAARRL
jgi:molybdopterin-guanine dinucleotide biosynthesis protein A